MNRGMLPLVKGFPAFSKKGFSGTERRHGVRENTKGHTSRLKKIQAVPTDFGFTENRDRSLVVALLASDGSTHPSPNFKNKAVHGSTLHAVACTLALEHWEGISVID